MINSNSIHLIFFPWKWKNVPFLYQTWFFLRLTPNSTLSTFISQHFCPLLYICICSNRLTIRSSNETNNQEYRICFHYSLNYCQVGQKKVLPWSIMLTICGGIRFKCTHDSHPILSHWTHDPLFTPLSFSAMQRTNNFCSNWPLVLFVLFFL